MTSMTASSTTRVSRRAHRVVRGRVGGPPSVAAERHGAYDAGDGDGGDARAAGDARGAGVATAGATGVDVPHAAEPAAPFGLPVLAELPALATVLGALRSADDAMLTAVAGLADLLAGDEVERTTGVGVDHWLAVVAAQTRMDRRLLVRTCRLLHRLPTLDGAVRTGRVSFAQLRGLALALRKAPADLDDEVDHLLSALFDGLERMDRPDPDVLVRQVADGLDELCPDDLDDRERGAVADRYLDLQPFLDGTGGRFHGQFDAAGLALLDAASTPPDALLDHPGGYGAARAETLLARLAAADAGGERDGVAPDAGVSSDAGAGSDGGAEPGAGPEPGGGSDGVADRGPDGAPVVGSGASAWWDRLAAPKLLVRLPFEALLDGRMPADLLTTLVGGRLRLTSNAARRLVDERGAELRAVVIDDDGTVIGVGRSSRQPPGWLRDVQAAVHDTCTGPGCDRPARGADVDHARPWWPARPDDPHGATDVDDLGPLCPATNRAKEAAGWRVTQTGAGVRTWHHRRSGLTTTTVPSTWRPPADPRRRRPRGRSGDRHPSGPAPPGPDGHGAVDAASVRGASTEGGHSRTTLPF